MVLHMANAQSLLFDEHPRQNPDEILRQARISHNSNLTSLHIATSVNTAKLSMTRIQYELGSSLPYDYVSKGSSMECNQLSKSKPKAITVKEMPRFGTVMAALPAAASTATDAPAHNATSIPPGLTTALAEVIRRSICGGCGGDGRSATSLPVAASQGTGQNMGSNIDCEDISEDADDVDAVSPGIGISDRGNEDMVEAAEPRIGFSVTRRSASTSQPGADLQAALATASGRIRPCRMSATDIPLALLCSSRPLFPAVDAEGVFVTSNVNRPLGGSSGRRASMSCTGADPRDAFQAFSLAAAAGRGNEDSGSGDMGPSAVLPAWSASVHSVPQEETAVGPKDETRPSVGEWVLGRGRRVSSRASAARHSATGSLWPHPPVPTASNYLDAGNYATGAMDAEEGMCDMADISAVSTGMMNGCPCGDVAAAASNVGPSQTAFQRRPNQHLFMPNASSQVPQGEGPSSFGSAGCEAPIVRPTPTPTTAPQPLQRFPAALPGQLLGHSSLQDGPNSAPPGSGIGGRYSGMHAYGAAAFGAGAGAGNVSQDMPDPAPATALLPRMSAARTRPTPLSPLAPAAYPTVGSDASPSDRPVGPAAGVAALFQSVAPTPLESFASPPRASGTGGVWGNLYGPSLSQHQQTLLEAAHVRSTNGAESVILQEPVIDISASAGPDSGLGMPGTADPGLDPTATDVAGTAGDAFGGSRTVALRSGVRDFNPDLCEDASPVVDIGEQQQLLPPQTSACKSRPSTALFLARVGSGGGGPSTAGLQMLPAPSLGLKPTPLASEDRQLPPRPVSQSQGTRPLFPPPALQSPPSPQYRGQYNCSGGQSPSSPRSPVQQQPHAFTKRTPSQLQLQQQAWRRADGKQTQPTTQPPVPPADGENQLASSHGSPGSTGSSVSVAGDPSGSGGRQRFAHLGFGFGLGSTQRHSHHSHTPRSSHNAVQPLVVPGPALETLSTTSSVATSRAGTPAAPPSSCGSIGSGTGRRGPLPNRGCGSLEITPEEHRDIMARMKAALSFLHRGD